MIPSLVRASTAGNWLYHADSVVLESPLTTDVPSRGILDTCFFLRNMMRLKSM